MVKQGVGTAHSQPGMPTHRVEATLLLVFMRLVRGSKRGASGMGSC